jgi:hypothetical protein
MQLNVVFIATALLASASLAMSAMVTGFGGAGCSGTQGKTFTLTAPICFSLGAGSTRSISFSDVPNQIEFFVSGGNHDSCTNGASSTLSGSGCATAPDG